MTTVYGLIGCGGFGREMMPLVKESLKEALPSGEAKVYFVIEGTPDVDEVNGIPLIGLATFLAIQGDRRFNIAIADSRARARIADLCRAEGANPFDIEAKNAVILDNNQIGEGVVLSPFSMVTSNTKIGKFFQCNFYSYVAHDCVIGDYVTFAPSVQCNGNVTIGDHAYIGAGAILKPGKLGAPRTIGEGAVVGMGAVVINDVPPYSTVVGNPARVLRK